MILQEYMVNTRILESHHYHHFPAEPECFCSIIVNALFQSQALIGLYKTPHLKPSNKEPSFDPANPNQGLDCNSKQGLNLEDIPSDAWKPTVNDPVDACNSIGTSTTDPPSNSQVIHQVFSLVIAFVLHHFSQLSAMITA